MFPTLQPLKVSDPKLQALADAMIDTAAGNPSGNNPNTPAGFTYLGQFIDHDIYMCAPAVAEFIEPSPVDNPVRGERREAAAAGSKVADDISTATPLWYYILKEAKVRRDGLRLGPVGSIIVSEVFVGLVHGDHNSFLWKVKNWKPTLPSETPGDHHGGFAPLRERHQSDRRLRSIAARSKRCAPQPRWQPCRDPQPLHSKTPRTFRIRGANNGGCGGRI
jgi:hypothetical protein